MKLLGYAIYIDTLISSSAFAGQEVVGRQVSERIRAKTCVGVLKRQGAEKESMAATLIDTATATDKDHSADERLIRKTIQTRLEAGRWPAFAPFGEAS